MNGQEIVSIYANSRPVYYLNPIINQTKWHPRRSLPVLENLKVIVYDRSPYIIPIFNKTLNEVFEAWKQCSNNVFKYPSVEFTISDYPKNIIDCMPQSTNDNPNIFFVHLVFHESCLNLMPNVLGQGQINGFHSWIYKTKYWNNPRLIAHEFGHNLGLRHAARTGDEYGDPSCVMGNVDNYCCTKLCFNAPHTEMLGWMSPVIVNRTFTFPVGKISEKIFYKVGDKYFIQQMFGKVYVYEKDLNPKWDTNLVDILQPGKNILDLPLIEKQMHLDGQILNFVDRYTYPIEYSINNGLAVFVLFVLLYLICSRSYNHIDLVAKR